MLQQYDINSYRNDNNVLVLMYPLTFVLFQAMKRMDEKDKEVDRIMTMDERKRPYNVMYDLKAPTEEELEAYKRKRLRDEDPMTQFSSLGQ